MKVKHELVVSMAEVKIAFSVKAFETSQDITFMYNESDISGFLLMHGSGLVHKVINGNMYTAPIGKAVYDTSGEIDVFCGYAAISSNGKLLRRKVSVHTDKMQSIVFYRDGGYAEYDRGMKVTNCY